MEIHIHLYKSIHPCFHACYNNKHDNNKENKQDENTKQQMGISLNKKTKQHQPAIHIWQPNVSPQNALLLVFII